MAELRLQDQDKVRWVARRNVKARDKDGNPAVIAMVFCEFENGHRFTHAIPEGMITYATRGQHPIGLAENAFIESEVKVAAVREKSR